MAPIYHALSARILPPFLNSLTLEAPSLNIHLLEVVGVIVFTGYAGRARKYWPNAFLTLAKH